MSPDVVDGVSIVLPTNRALCAAARIGKGRQAFTKGAFEERRNWRKVLWQLQRCVTNYLSTDCD